MTHGAHAVSRIRRGIVVAGAAIALTSTSLHAAATLLRRVVWLGPADPESMAHIRQQFAKHGLVDGREISIDFQEIHGDADARRIVASRPDVIAGPAVRELLLMKQLTHDIPIVFHNLNKDPVRLGLVESMRRPGGNMTGTCHSQHWVGRMLSLLREIDPGLRIVGVLWTREAWDTLWKREYERESIAGDLKEQREDAARHGIEMRQVTVPEESTEDEIATAVRHSGAQALIVDTVTGAFLDFLNRTRIPTVVMYFFKLRKGALVAISFDFDEGAQQAFAMVARILRGENPATIPIYQQTRYATGVNLRTAKRIGVRIPDSLLVQADEIVR